jgi:hypothetical protein
MTPVMRRATIVYIGMVGLLVAGLWTILRVGRWVHAPHDLSGQWLIRPVEASPESEPLPMQVTQSGRFLAVEFPDMPPMQLTLQKEEFDNAGQVTAIHWEGHQAKLVVRLPSPPKIPDEKPRYWFELEKPHRATWRARRVVPKEVAAVSSTAH